MEKSFIAATNLEKMTNEQREEYYLAVCAHLDLPPQLRLLSFLWLDDNASGRNLVLYCLRGGTDMIRQNRGISVTELTKDIGDGYVIFTAKGQDSTGRTEMAVGVASIKDQVGRDLENAISKAQTRSIRRMTLQFVGGGILDESEAVSGTVGSQAGNQAYSELQVAKTPARQPSVAINDASGTDITADTETGNLPASFVTTGLTLEGGPDLKADTKKRKVTRKRGIDLSEPSTSESICWKPLEQLVAEGGVSVTNVVAEKPVITVVYPEGQKIEMGNCLDCLVPIHETSTDGRKRNEDGSFHICKLEDPYKKMAEKMSETVNESQEPRTVASNPILAAPYQVDDLDPFEVEEVAAPVLPSKEQVAEFRKRISEYANDILPKSGMLPTEHIGGVGKKVKLFAAKMFPQDQDMKLLTLSQWNSFFELMDGTVAKDGAKALVSKINEALGIKE